MAWLYHSRRLTWLCVALLAWSFPAAADDVLALQVLRGSGAPAVTSLADLDDLAQTEFTTTTIWTDGDVTFSGVSLLHFLKAHDVTSGRVRLTALNDYSVEMPLAELEQDAPIVATRINDALIGVRDKGPFWLVYPYDSAPRFRTETVFARSIWQLNKVTVLD